MSKSANNSGGFLDGCFNTLMVLAVLSFIGVLLLGGVGAVVYSNREKLGIPPVEEWNERFKAADKGDGEVDTAHDDEISGDENGGDPSAQSYVAKRPVAAMAPMHVNTATFPKVSNRSDVLVLVDYYADWCGPCKRLAPSLAKLAQKHGDKVIVLKVNIDAERQLAQRAGIRSIPDVRILHGGREVDKFVGLISYERIEKMILKHESLLPSPKKVPALKQAVGEGSIDPVTKKYLPPGILRK